MSDKVTFFDTTSRDGKQSPGCNHSPEDTVQLGHQLARLGIDIMEAGFAMASPADFEAVRRTAKEVPIRVCSLARTIPTDIMRAGEALAGAKLPPRIHVFIGSSDEHLRHKFDMEQSEILNLVDFGVKLALKHVEDVEFSPEDASRTGFDFLKEVVRVAIAAGAKTINVPDTTGYAVGDEYGKLFARLIAEVPQITEKGIV